MRLNWSRITFKPDFEDALRKIRRLPLSRKDDIIAQHQENNQLRYAAIEEPESLQAEVHNLTAKIGKMEQLIATQADTIEEKEQLIQRSVDAW